MFANRWGYIKFMSHVPYSSAIGNLIYVMVCTQPDISHIVSKVSRHLLCLGKVHWQAMKWILKYLNGTFDFGLEFRKNGYTLIGYVDFDYAGHLDKRSLTRYTLLFKVVTVN